MRVVIILDVDHQTFEHALHFGGHLVEQRIHLARLDGGRNIIVGEKTHLVVSQPFTDYP
jgi:hypothetical protein